jgi:hypothetical protein
MNRMFVQNVKQKLLPASWDIDAFDPGFSGADDPPGRFAVGHDKGYAPVGDDARVLSVDQCLKVRPLP